MRRLLTFAVASLLLATACGADVIAESDVEEQTKTQLAATVGQTPDDVDCPDDLEAKEGASMRCTLTAGGDEIGVTVTVTSVDGDTAKFDIEVDE